MGCTTSSLTRSPPHRTKITKPSKSFQKQTIFVVGSCVSPSTYFSQDRSRNRVRSWSPEERESICDEALSILEKEGSWSCSEKDLFSVIVERKQNGGFSRSLGATTKDDEDREVDGSRNGDGERDEGSACGDEEERGRCSGGHEEQQEQPFLPRLTSLESPTKLCSEQERRLRCINLEGPLGLTDFYSLDTDDEEEGFEFARVEDSPTSCVTEERAMAPFLESRYGINSDGLTPDTSFSENWERLPPPSCSISEPELEVLIPSGSPVGSPAPPPFMPLFLIDRDLNSVNNLGTLPCSSEDGLDVESSPGSALSVQASPCALFPKKNSSFHVIRHLYSAYGSSSFSGGSLFSPSSDLSLSSEFSPGFASHSSFRYSSLAESSVERPLSIISSSESYAMGLSPTNDSVQNSLSDSGRIEGFLSPSSTLEWTVRSADLNWGHSARMPQWELFSPSGSTFSQWDNPSASPASIVDTSEWDALIPGLPNDLAQLCIMRVPFIKYDPSFRMVCKRWRSVLSSAEFYNARKVLGIREAHISFVVHGNRVQVFNLQTHKWFCLPPLPREHGSVSPEWGIDPYDWWQIDTIAVCDGTLFVIGGDHAELDSFTRPSKPTNRVHKYDFCRNHWVAVSPMQVPRSHAAAVSLGKLIYVAGGSEQKEEGASAEVYDFHQNLWSSIASMNSSMRTCVGMEHMGSFYIKGENTGPGSLVEGEIFDPVEGTWCRMSPGMRRGLARGPIASANSNLFVADWKDSQLKMYDAEQDSWKVVARLPARISRLVGHSKILYGLTGKIKVDPYNHHVISDAPAEVWMLDLKKGCNSGQNESGGGAERTGEVFSNDLLDGGLLEGRRTDQSNSAMQMPRGTVPDEPDRRSAVENDVLCGFRNGGTEDLVEELSWECLWRDPKQMVKTGGLAWVPCIAHCTLFED